MISPPFITGPMVGANCRVVVTASTSSRKLSCGAIGDLGHRSWLISMRGQGFTQVRPLSMELKTYFLLVLYYFGLDVDYKDFDLSNSRVGDYGICVT